MRAKRQTIQLELALEPEAKGEARSAGVQGIEIRMVCGDPARTPGGEAEAIACSGPWSNAIRRPMCSRG